MHLLGGPKNRIYGTSLDTFGTANTFFFSDKSHHGCFFCAMFRVKRFRLDIKQISKGINGGLPSRRAFVDRFKAFYLNIY